jgi:hypothetical protein
MEEHTPGESESAQDDARGTMIHQCNIGKLRDILVILKVTVAD